MAKDWLLLHDIQRFLGWFTDLNIIDFPCSVIEIVMQYHSAKRDENWRERRIFFFNAAEGSIELFDKLIVAISKIKSLLMLWMNLPKLYFMHNWKWGYLDNNAQFKNFTIRSSRASKMHRFVNMNFKPSPNASFHSIRMFFSHNLCFCLCLMYVNRMQTITSTWGVWNHFHLPYKARQKTFMTKVISNDNQSCVCHGYLTRICFAFRTMNDPSKLRRQSLPINCFQSWYHCIQAFELLFSFQILNQAMCSWPWYLCGEVGGFLIWNFLTRLHQLSFPAFYWLPCW